MLHIAIYFRLLKFLDFPSNLGLSLQELGSLAEALDSYKLVNEIQPNHTNSKLNYCNILFVFHDNERGHIRYDDIKNDNSNNNNNNNNNIKNDNNNDNSSNNENNNNYNRIEKCYQDVLVLDSTYVRGIVNLGAYYQSMNNATYAIKYYKEALILDPLNSLAKHGLLSLRITEMNEINLNGNAILGGNDGNYHQNSEKLYEKLDENYVSELFDSYSFHFEESLKNLKYQSHLLVAAAVGE